ncbi:unnamed protein product [Triticum turgidum subsp. durum]|uniref:non-specific serine/threonine protein kinase n=1 Tax=Triticum turgidum subsp. durum TaxID=4567 RepID=A0A9R0TS69_TRITD|nr:unnamed protein product [Triticum turgidum subsp. durum]
MAQWNGMEQAATIAQLVGVDALGLISTIVQAAQTVQRNKETCQELVQDVQLINGLLRMLQNPEMMQREEIVNALNGLEGTLREAYSLVSSCQDCSTTYRIFMGWKHTDQFRRVKKKIAKHLRFYPMIFHADITCRLERISNGTLSTCSSQDQGGVLTSSTSHSNSEARTECSLWPVELEKSQTCRSAESIAVEEHQLTSHQEIAEPFARKQRFRWGHCLPWKMVETAPCIHELNGPGFSGFHFSQLLAATNNFAFRCKIRSCGYADVYKGRLDSGLEVMIKRFYQNNSHSSLTFENEVRFHAKLLHKNVAKLIGCCSERGEALLVYESLPNGCLSDAVTGTRVLLNWSERFKIILGIARGVAYLHDCCGIQIMHGDLNPQRILLDSYMTPKITDFAFAKVCSPDGRERHKRSLLGTRYELIKFTVKPLLYHLMYFLHLHIFLYLFGSRGYMDPGYVINRIYSVKSDVYSFGITLLEIITAKRPDALFKDAGDLLRLPTMAESMEMYHMIDPALHGESRMTEIMKCIQIALWCSRPNAGDRPSMWDVLLMLSCESATLRVPEPFQSQCDTQELCEGVLSDSEITEPR